MKFPKKTLTPIDRRLWTVEYVGPDGGHRSTVMAGVDESVVRYTMARYFPKVQVIKVTPAPREDVRP